MKKGAIVTNKIRKESYFFIAIISSINFFVVIFLGILNINFPIIIVTMTILNFLLFGYTYLTLDKIGKVGIEELTANNVSHQKEYIENKIENING